MKHKEITIKPCGGLANRMRALNSVIEFAKLSSIPVRAVWFRNFELNAPFYDLFETPDYSCFSLKEAGFFDRFLYSSPSLNSLWMPFFITPILFDTAIYSIQFVKEREDGSLSDTLLNGGRVFVESFYEFGDFSNAMSRNFTPKADILSLVNEFVEENFTSNTIGVHIRRTDNAMSIKNSPLSLFYDAMRREIEICADTKFYVATDDAATKRELKEIFGDRILSIDTDCNRNSLQGMKDAVREMWILSRTSKIYGSFYSSFSEVASQLGKVPLHILKLEE